MRETQGVNASRETMWATVIRDPFSGQLTWFCETEGDMGDNDTLDTIQLAADTFPEGTKLRIEEPVEE